MLTHVAWANMAAGGPIHIHMSRLIQVWNHEHAISAQVTKNIVTIYIKTCINCLFYRHQYYKPFSCSTQISMKFQLLIKTTRARSQWGAIANPHAKVFDSPPAPPSPTPGHDLGNRMKILFNMFSIFLFVRPHKVWCKNL